MFRLAGYASTPAPDVEDCSFQLKSIPITTPFPRLLFSHRDHEEAGHILHLEWRAAGLWAEVVVENKYAEVKGFSVACKLEAYQSCSDGILPSCNKCGTLPNYIDVNYSRGHVLEALMLAPHEHRNLGVWWITVLLAFMAVLLLGAYPAYSQADEDIEDVLERLDLIGKDLDRIKEFVRRPISKTGGPVSGSVLFQLPKEGAGLPEHISLPGLEVFLHNTVTGADSSPVVTDQFGRYRFPIQSPGRYELSWKSQRGWAGGNHPDPIVIGSGPQFPTPALLVAEKGTGVVYGKITQGDKRTPWSYDEMFNLNHTASVTVLNAVRSVTFAGPLKTNAEGYYVAAGIPRSTATTLRVTSQAAISTRVLDPARVSVGNPVQPSDLSLDNMPPELVSVTAQSGGQLARTAAPGDSIEVVAAARDLNGDPLSFEWAALDGHGTITAISPGLARWTLPLFQGRYSAYVQASDGRGAFVSQRIDFTTGKVADLFSGIAVEKESLAKIKDADVSVNGKTGKTDANGFFAVEAPLSDRYVMTITKPGFAEFSRVVDFGMTGQTWQMVEAFSRTFDPKNEIVLVDERRILDKKRLRGSRIIVPANSLVDVNGSPPSGDVTGHIATLDIKDGEAPGDWGAKTATAETNLISYGATFVEFLDAAGTKFNLTSGQEAKIEMFAPPTLVAGAPATAKLWSYDPNDGYWKESGKAGLSDGGGLFSGTVTHFSTINTDVEKDDDACLKILIYPPIPTGVKLRVKDPSGSVFAQTYEGVLDAGINAVFRLPSNTDVQLSLLTAAGAAYPGTVLLEEVPGVPLAGNTVNTGPALAAGQSSFPPEPYEPCKLVIMREANEPTANAFLAFKGDGSAALAAGYYDAVDPLDERLTLGAWWAKNGIVIGAGGIPTNATRTSYLNNNDLGSGRDMYFLQRPDGTVAAYVTNYGLFDQNHANADLAANKTNPGATVAMEYSAVEGQGATRIVKFFVFAGADFDANAPRVASANLDGFAEKFVPNLCLNCHGGNYSPGNAASPSFAEINMGAAFRELDIATYKFPGGRTAANASEKANFKGQNLVVKGLNPTDAVTIQPVKDLISGWYAGGTDEQDNTFIPGGWLGAPQQDLYRDFVKHSCRTCHVGLDSNSGPAGIGWISYDQLRGRRGFLDNFVLCEGRIMPHAVITYRNFWLSGSPHQPAVLRNFSNGSGWSAIGPCQ
ncbi:MAG: carboxypeptidase regulatory-like domain-containing protein [Mesorhizobium sp.]|uniref:hypothetical protein n=1 Tax=Mesorhizobium sp. TaxID=1871066 RepID=UPI001210B7CB|nr:hypothetical protein [Mesorhizobium sp.]TIL41860.1 MAG: carboxypeptidase regulatory-like domain-containing protein [Mesorhizobium sp.]TIL94866.1 MAG: carboxypeptidase regulatory-like domain-containing protein [Mesorhizobium sp.]